MGILIVCANVFAACGDEKKPVPSSAPAATVSSDAAAVRHDLPPWIQIRVGRVRIAKGPTNWDGPKAESGFSGACKALVQSVGGVHGVDLKDVSGFACNLLGDSQVQSDPTLPDLQVQLSVHDTTYKSYIAFDQTSHTFDYPFAMPVAGVPDVGIVLVVVDADDGGGSQEIGAVRVTKEQLADALASKSLLSLSAPGVDLIEVDVSSGDGSFKRQIVKLDTKKGGETVTRFNVFAGEVVRIEATGHWDLGGIFSDQVGPDGHPGEHNYNLPLFHDEANGAAVAIVGRTGSVFPVVVREGKCARFVSPYSGSIWVGVNDSGPNDNSGIAEFTVMKRGADAAQWQSPGSALDCIQ